MSIEKKDCWVTHGQLFLTEEKAIDYAENLVTNLIKQPLLDKGFTVSQWVRISQVILDHREQLRNLLDY